MKKKHILQTMPAMLAAVATCMLLLTQCERNDDDKEYRTSEKQREHELYMNELKTVYVCAKVLRHIPVAHRGKVFKKYLGTTDQFACGDDWCESYRQCLGKTVLEVPDGCEIAVTNADAWKIALPVRQALESYDSFAHLACRGVLSKELVLAEFKRDFYEDSAMLNNILEFYPPDKDESQTLLPGVSAVVGELYPSKAEKWVGRWKKSCED